MIWEDVGGVRTEVYHFESRDSRVEAAKEHIHLILCPGNPGCLFFYLTWLQDLQRDLESIVGWDTCVSTHGLSHAGHHFKESLDTSSQHIIREYTFEEQITHYEAFCEQIVQSGGGTAKQRLILVGHSIGAYAVVEVLVRNEGLRKRTIAIHLLMPFIQWRNLGFMHAMKIRAVLSFPDFVSNYFADRVPKIMDNIHPSVKAGLIRKSHNDMDNGSVEMAATEMFSTRLFLNFVRMARTEVQAIIDNEDAMLQWIKQLSGQIPTYALYTDHDVWAPMKDYDMLRKELPFVVAGYKPNLTHAFSTSFEKGDLVRELMVNELTKLLVPADQKLRERGGEHNIMSKL